MYENFPYSNFHDLNTDWIVKKIKDVETSEANAKASEENAKTSALHASLSDASAQNWALQANNSANRASEQAQASAQSAAEADNYVTSTRNQVNLLQSRVDNIIPSGTQTEGNTELLDIRVAVDGKIYDSAGNAVRGQVRNLKNALNDALNTEYNNFGVTYHYERNTSQTEVNTIKLCPFPELGTYLVKKTGDAINLVGITGNSSTAIISLGASTKEITLSTPYEYLGVYANTDTTGTLTIVKKESQNSRIEELEADVDTLENVVYGYDFKWINGLYVLYSNGDLSTSVSAKYVDYVPCKGIDTIVLKTSISSTGAALAFYDADKQYMQAASIKGIGSEQNIAAKVPTGAAFFRCSEYNYDDKELSVITTVSGITNRLKNKKVMFFGDSITWNESRYVSDLLTKSGMIKVHNFAVTGATLTNNQNTVMDGNPSQNSNNTVPNQVQQMLNGSYETPHIVIISASTNDTETHFVYDETQYSYADVANCDLTNASGAIRWMYEKIMSVYPDAQVYYATPIQSATPTRTFAVQKIKRDVIAESCERISVYIIDAFYKSGIYAAFENNGSNGKYLIDGLHPNANGAKVIASCYYDEILNIVRD